MTGYESKKAMAQAKLDSMEREALKLALDLATMHHTDDGYAELRSKVRQFAKEALAQPAQEPVAWYHNDFGVVELSRIPRAGWKLLTTPLQPAQEPVREALKLAKNLLDRCETEMRYAGWTTLETDNTQRQELYIEVQAWLKEKNNG